MPTQWDSLLSTASPFPEVYDYTVYKTGTTYNARNNSTGALTSNTSFSSLMASLNTALSTGGTIFFMKGTYSVDAAIRFTNNINLIGDGRGQTIIQRAFSSTKATITHLGATATVARLTLDGNYPADSSNTVGELAFAAGNYVCSDMECRNFIANGVSMNNGSTTFISNSYFNANNIGSSSVSYNIYNANTDATLIVVGCSLLNHNGNAVICGGRTVVDSCYIAGNGGAAGGQLVGSLKTQFMIASNNVIGSGAALADGIELAPGGSGGVFVITNNTIIGQAQYGIVSNGTPLIFKAATIKNNVIKNCGQKALHTYPGIYIQGAQTNFAIEGNICFDDQASPTQSYGIKISNEANNHYTITDNICFNNADGQILDQGTGTDKFILNNIGLPRTDIQSASGLGLNFTTFVSGNTGNFVAANSGVFGPVGFFYVQVSGGTTYKVPFMNS